MDQSDGAKGSEVKTREELVREVEELRQKVAALEQTLVAPVSMQFQHQQLLSLFESIDVPIYVSDPETYEVLFVNSASREHFGDVCGKRCYQALQNFTAPCPFCTNQYIFNENLGKSYIWEFQNKVNSRWYRCIDKAILWPNGTMVRYEMAIEITDIKEARRELKESKQELKTVSQEFDAILDAIPDSLSLLTQDLKILWANKGTADGLSRNISDLAGNHCYKVWHKRSAPCDPCPALRSFESRQPEKDQSITPDGKVWELRVVPILDENGEVTRVVQLGRDVTEHRKLEEQFLHAQKMEAIGRLAGGIAHDFNNILTAIIGYSNLLKVKMKPDDPLFHYVAQISSSADRASSLTQSLLSFGRKQMLNSKPLNLNETIRRVEKLLLRLIGEDIELTTSLSPEGLIIMGDSSQIEQVLMNLATNARDAMPDGGSLSIHTTCVELANELVAPQLNGTPGIYALITFTDSGVGINDKLKEKIFEPFFTTKDPGKGTGLGLSIVYGIVKQHGGHINVYSEPRKGTTFKLYFPLINAACQKAQIVTPTLLIGGTETVLIAEDEEEVRVLLKEVLEEFGYTVIEATEGRDAVHKFGEHKDAIDLVLLDVIMPKKNGKEAFKEMRKIKRNMKAIFMSGYTADIINQKKIDEKSLHFLSKPIITRELLEKIREVLDR